MVGEIFKFQAIGSGIALALVLGLIVILEPDDPEWNVLDWPHVGRMGDVQAAIDKRQSADSTAYIVSHLTGDAFRTVIIAVEIPGECWKGVPVDGGFKWTRTDGEVGGCHTFDLLDRAFEAEAGDE